MVEGRIKIEFVRRKVAEAIAEAVSPDNKPTPKGIYVKTWKRKGKLLGRIRCSRGVEAFLSTLDDLLASVQVAEKSLEMVEGEAVQR